MRPLHSWACWGLLALGAICGCTQSKRSAAPTTTKETQSLPQDGLLAKIRQQPNDVATHLALAEQDVQSGETFAAIEQLEVARQLGADPIATGVRVAELYRSLGEVEQSAAILSQLAALPNATPEIHLMCSRSLLSLGDFESAARAVMPLSASFPSLPAETQQVVVRTLLLAGDTGQAAKLLPQGSADSEWVALYGFYLLARKQPAEAAKVLAQAVARNPQDAWNRYLAGWAWSEAGDNAKALEAWKAAAQLPDAPARALTGAARLLAEVGQGKEAQSLLRRVQGEDTNDPAYWRASESIERKRNSAVGAALARGYTLYYGGDPWQAEAVWKAVLPQARDEDARELYAAIFNSGYSRQDPATALRYATEACKRWPQEPFFLKRRAETLLGQNTLKEAQQDAEHFQKIAPPEKAWEAAELLCRIALDAGNGDLLRKNADLARNLNPADSAPLLHLAEWEGQYVHTPENRERTLQLYRDVMALDPKNAEAPARAGILLAELKRPDEAITSLLHALTLDPRVLNGAPNAQLARLYSSQGRAAEARFEESVYQERQKLKEEWPVLLKALRQPRPAADYRALGEAALKRHENWIALCAFTQGTRLAPVDPTQWRGLAAVNKRYGRFEEAFAAMLHARTKTPLSPEQARGAGK